MMHTTSTGSSQPAAVGSQSEQLPFRCAPPARPKRRQVARACDWCRLHRVRCDNDRPCANCRGRGEKCTSNGESEMRTLPHALREIEKLKRRIKDLERQLEDTKQPETKEVVLPPSPPQSLTAYTPEGLDALKPGRPERRYWEGIHARTAKSQQTQFYGPSSLCYYIGRLSSYLATALQQPHLDHHFHPNSASRSFACPTSSKNEPIEENLLSADIPIDGDDLTGTQEDYFLNLFWQSYHSTLPILDEREFREYYKSLWDTPGKPRRPSALVDIILAITMQYGVATLPRPDANTTSKTDVDSNDATIAGRWFYRRCQALLAPELESPSISTLQCHMFSLFFLCNASFQNMAHSTLAVAVRTAHILGIHTEPSEDMPRPQRELRKRLWWTLYATESKTCMKLGRPFYAQLSQATASLPADDHELALHSGSNFGSFGEDITWLTHGLHHIKLLITTRTIYTAFYHHCSEILGRNDGKSLYNDPEGLENAAEFLSLNMQALQQWLANVPEALKMKRQGNGERFSTDRSPVEVERFAPQWLKRQQVLLELLYHNLSMNLYRPFICFSPISRPNAESNAISCVKHAMAITHIIHQILNESDILPGWHEAYQWQWNASLSLIGFILAHPNTPLTPIARNAINKAITVFETFGNHFAIAASAANVTHSLIAKIDILLNHSQSGTKSSQASSYISEIASANPLQNRSIGTQMTNGSGGSLCGQLEDQTMQDSIANSLGIAFTMDSLNIFQPYWDNGGVMDYWTYTQD
ncbi:fungal specific transcription factor domain-containing protein, variant [Blastomyces gilchristii SLH14081]|uniref:Fungal specific transcription factor domain-containing protein n=1 Tax=Blastomyces gilchristii (strain SLH14081) TaxID=559298 RepID=A0A179UTE1_BLAGS|nr:fungal specific transcription factor domain-containing protein [Blastomyces gilchristii SLH14081]XP_031579808.1 fungal specific transcription factor domain-containing protein, variant [Blastomyces gilchristii SLH14081]OAT11366.1 fungal specific transcription factor domain-containing protein [Blastomyces gilchristii SLH14081]OAT11367.1 fungal specific transcription factor domain-containing protein, variant [Blastomyces gilchristii SLH14081]